MGLSINGVESKLNKLKHLDYTVDTLIQLKYEGVLGVESASGIWGLSSYDSSVHPTLFREVVEKELDGVEISIGMTVIYTSNKIVNKVHLGGDLYITDREQTICDMIRYNRGIFHLYETVISAFSDERVDKERLISICDSYNITDKLYRLYEEALKAEEEDIE